MQRSDDGCQFFTFDLFDTLIARTVPAPEDLFLSVGARLRVLGLWTRSDVEFQQVRIAADGIARRKLRLEEISLDQIYQSLASKIGWSAAEAQTAQAIEIEEELACVRPIAEMRARWNGIDRRSRAIVSDTYFSRAVIERMLELCEIRCDPDRLFLSSVHGKRKSTGRLFSLVVGDVGVDAGKVLHVGDNARSDVSSALKKGISAELYAGSAPRRLEHWFRALDGERGSRIAGALRAARLAFPGGTERERTLWEVGTMVAGPILFAYVSWILARANEEDLQHLYFLARDGQILLQLARMIDPALSCSYLLASRQAWHLPSIVDAIDEKSLSWIADGHAVSSLRNVLNRVGIEPEQIESILGQEGFSPSDWELPVRDRRRLTALFANENLRILVFERAAEARESLRIYLETQGVLAAETIGLVDLGWNGRLQRSLSRMLRVSAPTRERRIHGFYFALRKADREAESGQFHPYCGPEIVEHRAYGMLMELFCSAVHGGLLGFARNGDGSVKPMLVQEEDRAVLDWGLRILDRAILTAAENLLAAGAKMKMSAAEVGSALREPAAKTLNLLADRPTHQEAEAFGSFPFTYDQHHAEVFQMAPAYSASRVLAMFLPASIRAKGRTMWIEATLVRSLGRWAPLALPLFGVRDRAVNWLHRRR